MRVTARPAIDSRRLASRSPSDRRRRAAAVGLTALLSFLLLGILAYGYAAEFVLPGRQVVVRIGEVEYTRGDVLKLLRARQATVELLGGRMDGTSDVIAGVLTVVEDEIISQSARTFGISAPDVEVETEIRRSFLGAPNPDTAIFSAPGSPNPDTAISSAPGSPNPDTEKGARERYRELLNRVRLSEAEHFEQVRKAILREKLRQSVGESVPRVVEHVRLHRVAMRPDDEIEVMRAKLADLVGDSPGPMAVSSAAARVVAEMSRDAPDVVRDGGDLGWVPKGVYPGQEAAFFDLAPGVLSGPVRAREAPGVVYFYLVSERAPARELTDAHRDALKSRALREWLDGQRERFEVYTALDSEVYGWMVRQLSLASNSAVR